MHKRDKYIRDLLATADKAKAETTASAKEVLEHVYRAILAMPEFTLKDGTKARLDAYISPEIGKDGELQCGFDVQFENRSHLEFMIQNTGWGRPLGQHMASGRRDSDGPSR